MTLRRTFEKCCCCFYSCCSYCSSSCRRQFGSCHFNLNAQIESSEWGRQRVKSKKQNRDLKIQLNCCCAASNVLGERGIGGIKKCYYTFLWPCWQLANAINNCPAVVDCVHTHRYTERQVYTHTHTDTDNVPLDALWKRMMPFGTCRRRNRWRLHSWSTALQN